MLEQCPATRHQRAHAIPPPILLYDRQKPLVHLLDVDYIGTSMDLSRNACNFRKTTTPRINRGVVVTAAAMLL